MQPSLSNQKVDRECITAQTGKWLDPFAECSSDCGGLTGHLEVILRKCLEGLVIGKFKRSPVLERRARGGVATSSFWTGIPGLHSGRHPLCHLEIRLNTLCRGDWLADTAAALQRGEVVLCGRSHLNLRDVGRKGCTAKHTDLIIIVRRPALSIRPRRKESRYWAALPVQAPGTLASRAEALRDPAENRRRSTSMVPNHCSL